MGKVIILPQTTKSPITVMGQMAGICFGAPTGDPIQNKKRGLACIRAGHGRLMEFCEVHSIIDGYSARVLRQWYTHIGGSPTRLQESTRRVDCCDFGYIVPPSVSVIPEASSVYDDTMEAIKGAVAELTRLGVPLEDAQTLLPMGMASRMVDKRNARNLADMCKERLCTKAYWEYRGLMKDYLDELADYDDEWGELIKIIMAPKCHHLGYCPERDPCGMMPGRDTE